MKGEKIFDSPCVAFDNSPHSCMVLDIVDSMKGAIPRINIIHVHNPKKNYLLQRQKGLPIYKYLKERYPEQSSPGISVQLKDNLDKNTNLVILESVLTKSSSILFVGFVGSKGAKSRDCDLSSRIRQFVYESKINLAIVKQSRNDTGKVLFLLDGSQNSMDGLINTIQFCKRFGKQLTVLHTFNQDLRKHSKNIKIHLKTIQEERKDMKWEQVFEEKSLIEAIKQRENGYDWVALNKNGQRGSVSKQRFVGSNTSRVLAEIHCNLIIFA